MTWELFCTRLRKLLAITTDGFYRRAFLQYRVAPAIEHAGVLRCLPFDFVADVGANRGQFSLVCRRQRPAATIFGFEPLSEPAKVYRALFSGDTHVTLHDCALGQARGEISMNISARDDSSSLLPISAVQIAHFPGTGTVANRQVAIGPLSDFVQPSDLGGRNLLKIDVQGYELEVLKSAETLLSRFEWIYIECSYVPLYEGQPLAPDVIGFVTARGFDLKGRFNISAAEGTGEPLQADFLFVRTIIKR